MRRTLSSVVVIVGALAIALAGCGSAPTLPTDASPQATYEVLTGSGGPGFLHDVSTHAWSDGGAEVGRRFVWIGKDADSAVPTAAARAGQSAQVLAQFLADSYDGLVKLHSGFLGLRRETLGRRNPELLRAYAEALTPFQEAMFRSDPPVPGFAPLDPPGGNLPRTRDVFMLIDSDGQAGTQFTLAARQHADDLVRRYATDVVLEHTKKPSDAADLDAAAALYGLADAGSRRSFDTRDECVNGIPCLNTDVVLRRAKWIFQNAVIAQVPPQSPYGMGAIGSDGKLLWVDDLPESEKHMTWQNTLGFNLDSYGVGDAFRDFRVAYQTVNTFG
jgi:hypothetical protein